MASKQKKAPVKTTKPVVKKLVKSAATKKKAPASKVVSKKKVVKPTKPAAKKTVAPKKQPQKKAAVVKTVAKKTAVSKPAVSKKATPVKKIASIKKTVATKKVSVKKLVTPKKTVPATKKAVQPSKSSAIKLVTTKPKLQIVASNKGKSQPAVKKVTTPSKMPEQEKSVPKSEESIDKGVKKRIMQPLEVKVIKPSSAGLFGVTPYEEKDGEEFMNETQKNHFREILWRWKRELMEEVDRTKSHMQDGAARHPDPSDNATQEEEFNLELRTRDRERKLIKKIDEALERIDHDDYGYCDACGVEIGIRRLEARPTAEMCIDCKTLDEIKEKQTRA